MFIFVFLTVIILLSLKYKKYNEYHENRKNEQLKREKERKKDILIKEDPCFLYENINRTQLVYLKLINVLKELSHDKDKRTSLEGELKNEVFVRGIMAHYIRSELNQLTNLILSQVNSITGFAFVIVDYDFVKSYTDKDGNIRYIYDVFVQDTHEALTVRLFIDVIKYINPPHKKTKKPVTCAAATTPGMNTYEAGYPQPEQLIPLPTQIVYSGYDVIGHRGVNVKEPAKIAGMFINEVRIYNSSEVLNANGECLANPTCGNLEGETTLDSSAFNGPTTPFAEGNCQRNKWIDPLDKPKNVKEWPCSNYPFVWDTKGVPFYKNCNSEKGGVNSAYEERPVVPEYNPTIMTVPRNSGPNYWLFNLTRGDPATEGADYTN